ncbi:molybdopterin-guanine dinucleotide biosynthesis protein B [Methanospirillum hungatei JF-1]|jgi:molybdopterin-guanine dinucleotide biosynthesis protein MobB|uniref:Molybdopterin-guanine dinucleotide biosynthesis protein B n=1 Tax=Methanospirillum hungatei JF-1 (strain ATCC 27890 / DSM 864 / NBRC 100397 / JF-1) TaxID=323259 RepID=Q2FMB2_METHJ|nr:molybdopterin-guanine dinucleotide biosynthesis protein B [Methanospirillum hungatei]ABD41798.1 molybdopterin-guanine dinucleotide biosynthesis protein B [Methanospirillum hungatei JF-1]MBP9008532.1 molybdopterin-guanine dinucleotide biosynthesis protein B [Methanospirillum sp.]OQA51419.1 MAG: molybdopterin-guanine dinucleotide biosynthesis protein B [Euryarchaeota archaeon ADurb.Bin294]HOW06170.1 molybdopterin-guanine dinucleotide biosynthesis protein B [Methanospirillum hungatei]
MKVIHIAGWSGSGKTTFILELCSHLVHRGRTATIKHIGSHYNVLPLGKDTTLHFEAGADPAIGIDDEKTSASFHSTNLDDALNHLSDSGIRYTVIEGFKKRPFQKILIGDLDGKYLLKNPQIPDVLAALDQFDDWYTMAGLMKELSEEYLHCQIVSWTGYTSDYVQAAGLCSQIEEQYAGDHRISGIRARVQRWVYDDRYPVYLVMAMPALHADVEVFSEALKLLHPLLQS